MTESASKSLAWRMALTFLVTLAILTVGFALLEPGWAITLALAATAICGTLGTAASIKDSFRDDPPAGTGLRWAAAIYSSLAQLLIGGVFVGTLVAAGTAMLLSGAVAAVSDSALNAGRLDVIALAAILGAFAVLTLAGFFLAFSLATIGPTTAGEAMRKLGRRWFAVTWRQLGVCLILGLALSLAIDVAVCSRQIVEIAADMHVTSVAGYWDVMAQFIELPLQLLAAAALLATHGAVDAQVMRFLEATRKAGTPSDRTPVGRLHPAVATTVAGALLVGAYGGYGLLRIAMDSADSGVPMIAPVFEIEGKIDDWLTAQAAAGTAPEALAQRLNEAGHYRTEAPGDGLVELLPALSETLKNLAPTVCRFDIQAGARNMGEQASIDRVELDIFNGEEKSEGRKMKQALTVRYCMKAVCTGKLYRGSRPITWLVSSHVSANNGWLGGMSTSMLFYRIHSDGGYCTSEGALADDYRA